MTENSNPPQEIQVDPTNPSDQPITLDEALYQVGPEIFDTPELRKVLDGMLDEHARLYEAQTDGPLTAAQEVRFAELNEDIKVLSEITKKYRKPDIEQ